MTQQDDNFARSIVMSIAGQHLRGEKIGEADRENYHSLLAHLGEVPLWVTCGIHHGDVLMWPTEEVSQGGGFHFTEDGSKLLCGQCNTDLHVAIREIEEV